MGWVGIIDTDWNRVSYNLISLEGVSLSNYVLSIVAWDTNHLSMKNFRYEQLCLKARWQIWDILQGVSSVGV